MYCMYVHRGVCMYSTYKFVWLEEGQTSQGRRTAAQLLCGNCWRFSSSCYLAAQHDYFPGKGRLDRTSPPKCPMYQQSFQFPIYKMLPKWLRVLCQSFYVYTWFLPVAKLCHLLVLDFLAIASLVPGASPHKWGENEDGLELFERGSFSFRAEQNGAVRGQKNEIFVQFNS